MKNHLDAVKENVEKAGSKVNVTLNKEVAALKQNNRDLKRKLKELTDAGQNKWIRFKWNIGKDMDGVTRTMKDLFKRRGQ